MAVTSRDGLSVNERFHRAVDDFVFDVDAGGVTFVGRRTRPGPKVAAYRNFEALRSVLSDCGWIVSLGFNPEARRELARLGLRCAEARGPIEMVLPALLATSPTTS